MIHVFLQVNLDSSRKIAGQIPGFSVFGGAILWAPGTRSPPALNPSYVPGSIRPNLELALC